MGRKYIYDDEEEDEPDLDDPIRLPPANDGYSDTEYERNRNAKKRPGRRRNAPSKRLEAE